MESNIASNLVRLTMNNYNIWSVYTRGVLMAQDLIGIVNGTEPVPNQDDGNYALFMSRTRKAHGLLILSLSPEILNLLPQVNSENPRSLWLALENQFKPKTWVSVNELKRKFHSLMMEENENVNEFLKKVNEIQMDLALAGVTLTETEKVTTVLNGLSSKFSALRTAFAVRDDPPSWDALLHKLTNEAKRFELEEEKELGRGATALVTMNTANKKPEAVDKGVCLFFFVVEEDIIGVIVINIKYT